MSGDIVERLRALALHDDLSIGIVAADEIEQLTRERDEARAEVDRLTRDRRERIATAALQGILACVENGIAPESWADFIPQRAVIYADALIAEFDKEAKP